MDIDQIASMVSSDMDAHTELLLSQYTAMHPTIRYKDFQQHCIEKGAMITEGEFVDLLTLSNQYVFVEDADKRTGAKIYHAQLAEGWLDDKDPDLEVDTVASTVDGTAENTPEQQNDVEGQEYGIDPPGTGVESFAEDNTSGNDRDTGEYVDQPDGNVVRPKTKVPTDLELDKLEEGKAKLKKKLDEWVGHQQEIGRSPAAINDRLQALAVQHPEIKREILSYEQPSGHSDRL